MLVYFCLFLLVFSGTYDLWKLLLWIFIIVSSLLQIISFNVIKCFACLMFFDLISVLSDTNIMALVCFFSGVVVSVFLVHFCPSLYC